MKKGLLALASLFSILISHAQNSGDFAPFKVDIALGAAVPQGSGSKGGVLFAIEPKYAVMPEVSVGLRIEGAVVARGFAYSDGSYGSGSVSASGSYLATGDYYFTNMAFRPFAGAGVGIYSIASASVDENGNTAATYGATTKAGGMVRAGFELGHFRFGLEYNVVGKTTMNGEDQYGNPTTISSKNSYLGVKFGFFIGGGRQ